MRTDNLYIAGAAARVPDLFPVAEAVRRGWYDAGRAEAEGWTSVAIAGDLSAPELAAEAGIEALKRSGLVGDQIDMVLHSGVWHQGPEGWYAANYVQDQVVGTTAPAVGMNQGCTAVLDAIRLAYGYLSVDPDANAALVTAADNFGTPLVDRWNYADGWGSGRGSILGDAGGAVVVSTEGGPLRIRALAMSSLSGWEHLYRGDEAMYPPPVTRGVQATLGRRMASYVERHDPEGYLLQAVTRDLVRARTTLARQVMEEAGVGPDDITRVTHVFTGHPRYLANLLRPLGIAPERGLLDLGRAHGHLASTDQVLGLTRLMETGAVSPGDHILMMGNGGSISLACAVVEVLEQPSW
ncbi:ketoacyl-ACP synthase III family protein [Streptomyces sp. NPDC046685]|uniref:ketoacyl-ACP synthase III family protein n=1 Tax=Streptomyces sp. NPDC046685 TaxID=3157202 RepID=UPI0033E732BA